jgi:TP901 family phage tail tape measure protein
MASAGSQMLLGIRLHLDAQGMVTGASVAEDSLQRVENKARQTQTSVKDTGDAMSAAMNASLGVGALGAAAMGAGEALDSALTPAVNQAKSFQVEMSQLQFVAKATEGELKRLEDVALRTGVETQFSPQEAASAIRMLKAAGLSTEQTLESLGATLDTVTGSAGMMDLQTGATATAASLMKFVNTGETAREVMDTFAQATRETNLQFRDLPIFINAIRDAPTKLKASAAEVMALGGVLKNAGMEAAQSGQSVDIFANKLIMSQRKVERYLLRKKISEQDLLSGYVDDKMPMAVRAFQRLGVSMFDAQGKVKNMTSFIKELVNASQGLKGESEKTFITTMATVLGQQGTAIVNSLRQLKRNGLEGSAAFEDLVKSLENSSGASREAAAAFEDTQIGLDKFIEGTKDTINIALGQTLLPYTQVLKDFMKDLLGSFLDFINANPTFAKALTTTMVILMGLAKVIGVVLIGLAGLLFWTTTIAPALAAAGGAAGIAATGFAALQAAMWPILLIGLAIGAAFLAIWGIIKFFDHLRNGSSALAKSFQRLMKTFQWIRKGVSELWSGEAGKEQTVKALKAMGLYGIVTTIIGIKNRVVAVFEGFVDGLVGGFKAVALALYPVGVAIGWVIDAFRSLFEAWAPMKDAYDIAKGWRTLGFVLGWIASVVLTALIAKVALLALPFVILAAKVIIIAAVIGAVIYGLYKAIEFLVKGVVWLYKASVWAMEQVIAGIVSAGRAIGEFVVGFVKGALSVGDAILTAFTTPFVIAVDVIRGAINRIFQLLVRVKTRISEAGRGFVSAFLGGIKEQWDSLMGWLSSALQRIRDWLPGSDAKIGPLSTLTDSGAGFTRTFGAGIESGASELQGTVSRTLEGIAPDNQRMMYAVPDVAKTDEGGAKATTAIASTRGGTQITIQKMEFHVAQATPEEAENLAQQVIERIRELMDEETEVEFA